MAIVFQILLAALVGAFVCYVGLELRSLFKARGKQVCPAMLSDATALPAVSVLLPVYNEKLVVAKLIEAVTALDYPRERLEILVLDDSTDETSKIVAKNVDAAQARGINIRYVRRKDRIGYKAGNLNFGLGLAHGDFIAIFDADCLPPADFLRRVMPYFADEQVGFLQTGVAYANADKTFLTRFQAIEAGHKDEVTSGLASDGCMASLTGSSCVWRRSCIEVVGGISSETITEDVDLGYRAQLRDWKYVFAPQVVSLAEVPETIGAFRIQRHRWAYGLVHNAIRHVREMFAVPMPMTARMQAIALMFSSLLLASFYALIILALPAALLTPDLGAFFNYCCSVFLLAALVWAWGNTAKWTGKARLHKQLALAYGYIVMYFPLALYYFVAACQVFLRREAAFHRTPKGSGRKRVKLPAMNKKIIALELATFFYTSATLGLSLANSNYWVALYAFLATSGFAMTIFFTWSDNGKKFLPGHVLITGATGAIGRALALEYAGPGIRLTLQGRKAEILENLAGQCRQKGAIVVTRQLDLKDRQSLRTWLAELCAENVPDLVIANAGRNTDIGPDGKGEPYNEVEELVETNILANMALFDAILPYLRARKSGQFAITSSLAAYYGLALTPTYCATKAALKTWGQALRGWLHREGIRVNVILPGYVSSPMCDAMPGPKPFLWQPEKAARTIRRGLERDWARISFPFPLNLGIWGLSVLPACLAMPIAKVLGYER